MAKVQRKRTQTAASRTRSTRAKAGSRGRTSGTSFPQIDARQMLPYFLSICLIICIGAIVALGYRSAVSSTFFDVSHVSIDGVDRASKTEIEHIVRSETERTGVWNADLELIKSRIEKLSFVRSAAVARVLPNSVLVTVIERQPVALVSLASGPALVDEEGSVIAPAIRDEPELPFAMTGWNEAKTLDSDKENKLRVKMYRSMLAAWTEAGLVDRVTSVNVKDVREPIVLTEDSGKKVAIGVGRENFEQNLRNGLMAIAGKGETFEGVALFGTNLRLVPREQGKSK
jgi:cell division septal protein FtsQ